MRTTGFAMVIVGLSLAGLGRTGLDRAGEWSAQTPATQKVDIVSVTGCLREATPGNWTLTAATDPAPSSANAPLAKDLPSTPPAGKNQFKLIGVSEFNLPAHKEHTVLVKGLYIKAMPVSRLNITSVTMVAGACAPGADK
jgi:hypothetical protein